MTGTKVTLPSLIAYYVTVQVVQCWTRTNTFSNTGLHTALVPSFQLMCLVSQKYRYSSVSDAALCTQGRFKRPWPPRAVVPSDLLSMRPGVTALSIKETNCPVAELGVNHKGQSWCGIFSVLNWLICTHRLATKIKKFQLIVQFCKRFASPRVEISSHRAQIALKPAGHVRALGEIYTQDLYLAGRLRRSAHRCCTSFHLVLTSVYQYKSVGHARNLPATSSLPITASFWPSIYASLH
ncbi:hypothetical protein OF83DRAFT_412620 [Amylostereum chailletii]|nr:hypothetical protein OF83DRAFT_412620 [Amylostereum chailletii]